jgi:DNA repair protein RecN (Recombination protein N)
MKLLELKVKNYLVIPEIEIDFQEGLNIITGETGSGKSIILEAIQSIFSLRLTKEVIKTNETKALLEATIEIESEFVEWLNANELDDCGNILTVSREITDKGSKARINGTLVSTKLMQELGDKLFEIHNQSSESLLMRPKEQLKILDSFCCDPDLNQYRSEFQKYLDVKQQRKSLSARLEEREKELDYLSFQLKEIQDLQLDDPNEDNDLKTLIERASQAEALMNLVTEMRAKTFEEEDNFSSYVGKLKRQLKDLARKDEGLQKISDKISEAATEFFEELANFENYANASAGVDDLDAMNSRLNDLQKIKRKHSVSGLQEIIALQDSLFQKIEELNLSDESLKKIQKQENQLHENLSLIAEKLHLNRQKAADKLTLLVGSELQNLGFASAQFIVQVNKRDSINESGSSDVEFLFTANVGEPPRPVQDVASGGEMSRLMLILKGQLANQKIMIFDEIDSGTSGRVAKKIGYNLAKISKGQQVICITHQPLVASFNDSFYCVRKVHSLKNTNFIVEVLQEEDKKLDALVDLMTGENNKDLAKKYALELVQESLSVKKLIP